MNNTVTINNKPALQNWLHELGFFVGNHPLAFSDCFDYKDVDKEKELKFRSTSNTLSRIITKLLPPKIEGEIESLDKLIETIVDTEKLQNCATMKEYRKIVMGGINKAIGFNIIKKHTEVSKYSDLVEIRNALEANVKVRTNMHRASHKGRYGKEMIESIEKSFSAQGQSVISTDWLKRKDVEYQVMMKFVIKRALGDRDQEALGVMNELYNQNRDVFLPPPIDIILPTITGGVDLETHDTHLLPDQN